MNQNNYYIWFNKWDERYSYHGVEKEKEKDIEKDGKSDLYFYKNGKDIVKEENKTMTALNEKEKRDLYYAQNSFGWRIKKGIKGNKK